MLWSLQVSISQLNGKDVSLDSNSASTVKLEGGDAGKVSAIQQTFMALYVEYASVQKTFGLFFPSLQRG